MFVRARVRIVAAALVALVAIAAPASAQIITGTVTGTIKDAQGGVIPGATVVLVSQTRGTKMAPVVTNTQGDFVVPNLTADTYTIQVSDDRLQDVEPRRDFGQRRGPRRTCRR